MPELFRAESAAITADDKVRMALDLERYTVARDPRVTKVDLAQVGDAVSRVAIASTTGVDLAYERTDAWVVAVTLAVEGDETQTGFSFTIARGLDQLAWEPIADEAVDRAVQMLGAAKPETAKVPVILDPFAASNFLGVLAGALNADNVLKGRSLFADMVGQEVGAPAFTLVDDGRRADGPGACPFDGEGVPSGRTELFTAGVLNGFLHSTYTAHRAGERTALHRQREARRLQERARRRHVELLRRGGGPVLRRAAGRGGRRRAHHGRAAGCTPARTRSAASSASARPAGGSAPTGRSASRSAR